MKLRIATTLAALLGGLACTDPVTTQATCDDTSPVSAAPYCVGMREVTMRMGDTTVVAFPASSYPSATVAWTDGDTSVARIVRVDPTGRRVIVRGVRSGTTLLGFRVTLGAESVGGGLPVTVSASAP